MTSWELPNTNIEMNEMQQNCPRSMQNTHSMQTLCVYVCVCVHRWLYDRWLQINYDYFVKKYADEIFNGKSQWLLYFLCIVNKTWSTLYLNIRSQRHFSLFFFLVLLQRSNQKIYTIFGYLITFKYWITNDKHAFTHHSHFCRWKTDKINVDTRFAYAIPVIKSKPHDSERKKKVSKSLM